MKTVTLTKKQAQKIGVQSAFLDYKGSHRIQVRQSQPAVGRYTTRSASIARTY